MGKILEDWEVAGITTLSGGLAYDIFTDIDTAHTGQQQRADFNPAGTLAPVSNPRAQTGPNPGTLVLNEIAMILVPSRTVCPIGGGAGLRWSR